MTSIKCLKIEIEELNTKIRRANNHIQELRGRLKEAIKIQDILNNDSDYVQKSNKEKGKENHE